MDAWFYAVGSVVAVSVASLAGLAALMLRRELLHRATVLLVAFAVGGLYGDAFLHLLPEAVEQLEATALTGALTLGGIVTFFVVESHLRWRHEHLERTEPGLPSVAAMNLVGDAVHNLIDGLIIGASYVLSIPLGVASSLAILFHEIPQEIGDFGVLVHSGLTPKRALLYNFGTALCAVLGAILALALGEFAAGLVAWLLPFAAGGFIYIAGSDLVPELRQTDRPPGLSWVLLSMVVGIGVMAVLTLLE